VSPAELIGIENTAPDLPTLEEGTTRPIFDGRTRTTDLVIGERNLRAFIPAIHELRQRCGQQDDLTTDPQYFIAANTMNRRVAAVLIRHNQELEACVFFFEHSKFGIGLGIMRGGGLIGENCVAGPEAFRLQYLQFAVEALLRRRRIHGVSVSVRAPLDECLEVMGPKGRDRIFFGRNIQYKLPLESTYSATLAGMGPRTRRSLAGKRKKLEHNAHVAFLSSLEPPEALEAMLRLQKRSVAKRTTEFYRARYRLLQEAPEFFCMGLRLPEGTWLSVLSGCRRNDVTYIDLQMNDMHFKRESISAVMRAFMLEHEIALKQELIHFIGGTSLLLGRYCQPSEPCTDAFFWRPCLRAALTNMVIPRLKPKSFYTFVRIGTQDQKMALNTEGP
jgi:Acetyltransferase (GNAT) domain